MILLSNETARRRHHLIAAAEIILKLIYIAVKSSRLGPRFEPNIYLSVRAE